MSTEDRILPLFPLNTVLFPDSTLPLQIFEDRYKSMMKYCLERDSTFGVVLIKTGQEVGAPATPHSIGTVAYITDVQRFADGKMLVSAVGQQRFKINDLIQYHPYIKAKIELLDDRDESLMPSVEFEALQASMATYLRLSAGLRGGWVRDPKVPSDPTLLSYFIGGALTVGLSEKQTLLEELSTSKRLEQELDMLRNEINEIKLKLTFEMRRKVSRQ